MLILIDTLIRAAFAQPGYGPLDSWYNQTVTLACAHPPLDDTCKTISAIAYLNRNRSSLLSFIFNAEKKDLTHGVITFCPIYFESIPAFDAVVKNADGNEKSEQLNVLSMRSQGTVSSPFVYLSSVIGLTDGPCLATAMLHEWMHICLSNVKVSHQMRMGY